MKRLLQTLSLCAIGFWWVWFVIWLLPTTQFIQSLAYRFSPPRLTESVVESATVRAYEYSTHGGNGSDVFFTSSEVSHLNDVSRIFTAGRVVISVLAITGFLYLIGSILSDTFDGLSYRQSAKILIGTVVVLVLGLVFFQTFFPLFHKVFFPQGNWAFPENSMLIQLFPELFWQLMLGAATVLTLLMSLLYLMIAQTLYDHA